MVRIASPNASSPVSLSSPRAARIPFVIGRSGSWTPITPVEATATTSGSSPTAIAAAPCMRAALSTPRRPVAALALPALATTARSESSRQRSWHRITGAASTPERVKRAALTVPTVSETSRPMSTPPLGLSPQATPEARKPCGSPPSTSIAWSGSDTQRLADVIAIPRSRRARTSG